MDPSTTPWRILEDPAQRTAVGPSPSTAPAGGRVVPLTPVLVGGGVIVLALLALVLAFGAGANGTVLVDGGTPLGSIDPVGLAGVAHPGATSETPDLVVEIVGAIEHPGVFRLPPGSRVGDLVDAAGGYGTRVDADRASRELNLAAPLHDGDQVRVPSRDDEVAAGPAPAGGQAPSSGGTSPGSPSGQVDLNRATSAELEALPGIGPVTAGKILTSRDEQAFGAIEDLRTRGLLGEKTYDKIKDLVTVH